MIATLPDETVENETLARRLSRLFIAAAASAHRQKADSTKTRKAILELLTSANRSGELGSVDPHAACSLCMAIIDGFAAQRAFRQPQETIEHWLEPLVWGLLDRGRF